MKPSLQTDEFAALRAAYVQLKDLAEDQKRRLAAQRWKINEMRLLSEQSLLDGAGQIKGFQAQLKSALANYDGSTGSSVETNLPQIPPAEMWEKFIARLNDTQPIEKSGSVKHQSFLGSISLYRKIFLEANKK